MARSIAFYLTRFDEEPNLPTADFDAPPAHDEILIHEAAPSAVFVPDDMREQLIEEGRVVAKAEYDDDIERERAEFTERLDSERRRWANEEGERLGELIRVALGELTSRLEGDLHKVLEPFVVHAIREQMLTSLMDRLRIVLADRDNPIIHLSGPIDLLEAVCSRLNEHDVTTSIVDVGGVDVKARVDSTTIETRLGEWLAQLRGENDEA